MKLGTSLRFAFPTSPETFEHFRVALAALPPLAEQIGTIAAFSEAPLVVTPALGRGKGRFAAFGADEHTRVGRTEALVMALRALLTGEPVTMRGHYHRLNQVQTGLPSRVPVSDRAAIS